MGTLVLANPRKRRKSTRKAKRRSVVRARRANPIRRRRRRASPRAVAAPRRVRRMGRRRRNPAKRGDMLGQIMATLTDGAVMAGGALAIDVAYGYLPIPANMKSGMAGHGVKAAVTLLIGVAAQAAGVKSPYVGKAVAGALAVQLAGAGREVLKAQFPNLGLGEYMGEYMGEYIGETRIDSLLSDSADISSYLPRPDGIESTADLFAEDDYSPSQYEL